MSLDSKLKKTRDRVEEKSITLRIPQNKVVLLEALATHYGLTMSSLIREMLDESIIKLEKELLVVSEEAGMKITKGDIEGFNLRFLPAMVEIMAPDLSITVQPDDFCSDEAFDNARVKYGELNCQYGLSELGGWMIDTKGAQHEFGISKQGDKK